MSRFQVFADNFHAEEFSFKYGHDTQAKCVSVAKSIVSRDDCIAYVVNHRKDNEVVWDSRLEKEIGV